MTEREKRILAAALAWAAAERERRNLDDDLRDRNLIYGDRRRTVPLTAAWTTQELLAACESEEG